MTGELKQTTEPLLKRLREGADKAVTSGDVAAMLRAYKVLRGIK